MEKTTIVAIILGILVLMSAVQAFQMGNLKEKVSEGQATISTSSKSSASSSTVSTETSKKTAALPSSVKNLPQMVGGC